MAPALAALAGCVADNAEAEKILAENGISLVTEEDMAKL